MIVFKFLEYMSVEKSSSLSREKDYLLFKKMFFKYTLNKPKDPRQLKTM